MKIITLNVQHGGGSRSRALVDFLVNQQPDVVVLTEYRHGQTGARLLQPLATNGYTQQAQNCLNPKLNSVAIASRISFTSPVFPALAGNEQRLLVADFGDWRMIGAYFPGNEAKRPVFEHLRHAGMEALGTQGMLVGDLNTGLHYEDEAGATFFCTDAFRALLGAGLVDSWRSRKPQTREFSWYSNAGNGFRIDHALCTPALDRRVTSVQYLHATREQKITDHSAMVVEFV